MEFIAELILQFIGELLLQLVFELLVELGLHGLADTTRKRRHPVLSIIGFMIWGAMAGGISLWIVPTSLIIDSRFRVLNLIVSPVMIGAIMMRIGQIRDKKGQDQVQLDRVHHVAHTLYLGRIVLLALVAAEPRRSLYSTFSPALITSVTCSSTATSFSGSPVTAMMSA